MRAHSLAHLSDGELLRDLAALLAHDRTTTAALLAHLAEVDARRLYLPAAYPSMFAYCVHELRLSEDAAYNRIQAARVARQFPIIFDAVADGRLHLSGVVMLAPYLTAETVAPLLQAAAHKTKSEIELLVAERFPRSEMLALVEAIPGSPPTASRDLLAPGQVCDPCAAARRAVPDPQAPGPVEPVVPRSKVTPVAPQRFALQLTMGQAMQDKLRYAQELLSHQIPSGDVAQVLERALDALIAKLEPRKFAATRKPRPRPRPATAGRRHIPAAVKRAVWQRDGGQCTFVSAAGQRCPARRLIEFDHLDPVARGGQATVDRIQLRCRAHNQFAAECTFGTAFMDNKRQAARAARASAAAAAQDVVPWLRRLGFRADEARRAAAHCETIPDAPLEERVRVALSFCCPRPPSHSRAVMNPT